MWEHKKIKIEVNTAGKFCATVGEIEYSSDNLEGIKKTIDNKLTRRAQRTKVIIKDYYYTNSAFKVAEVTSFDGHDAWVVVDNGRQKIGIRGIFKFSEDTKNKLNAILKSIRDKETELEETAEQNRYTEEELMKTIYPNVEEAKTC